MSGCSRRLLQYHVDPINRDRRSGKKGGRRKGKYNVIQHGKGREMKIGDIGSEEGYQAWHPDKIGRNVTSACRVDAGTRREK